MKNVLIIEDSLTYREILCKALKDKGYKVKGVGSVKSALEEIKKDIYDFICADYNLPDDTGTALLQHELTKNMPICIMTASVDRHLFSMAKALGAVGCFDKAVFGFIDDLCNCIENQ
ncbi:response regulator [Mediterraneibacter gnavus]|uniref:response regulator n=1 Tax=Mediterraneibacter gnavus TaxID=33038 RepID=UPI0031B63FFD